MASKLESFRSAVEAENYERAAELATGVLDAQDERAEEERALSLAMQTSIDSGLEDSDAETAQDIAEEVNRVEQRRAELGGLIVGVARGTPDRGQLLDAIDDIQRRQQRLDDLRTDARDIVDAAGVGPIVSARAPDAIRVPEGEEGTGEITIRNVGSEAAADVTVEIESDLTDEDRVSLPAIDEIPVGTTTATLRVDTRDLTGRFRIVVRFGGDGRAYDTEQVKLVVLDAVTYLRLARSDLQGIEESILSLDDQLRRSTRPFENRIGKLVDEIDALIEQIESETGKSNGKNSPEKLLDRIEKHLQGLRGLITSLNQLRPGVRTSLAQEVEDVERAVDHARRALD